MNNELTSIEIKYLLRGEIENKDIVSLFLTWSIKGYISFQVENENITLIKQRDISLEDRKYEQWFFNRLFELENRVSLQNIGGSLFNEFQVVSLGAQKYLNKIDNQLNIKFLQYLLNAVIVGSYFLYSFVLHSNIISSIILGIIMLLPHGFASYIVQTFFAQTSKIANVIWGAIIYVSFIGILFLLVPLMNGSYLNLVITVLVSAITMVSLGYVRHKKLSRHTAYIKATEVEKFILEKGPVVTDDLAVTAIILNHANKLIQFTVKNGWTNLNLSGVELATKLVQLLEKLGKELAPNPMPSGTIAASK